MGKKKEEKVDNQKYVDFYLEYIKNTRKTWNSQSSQINQQSAYLRLANELGNITYIYNDVIANGVKIDTKEVTSKIGDISYCVARLLDELFYMHEEPFAKANATNPTLFDTIAIEMGNILGNGASENVKDIEIIDLILTLPCYYRDIYTGAATKDGKGFLISVLSLASNLADLSHKLGKNYGKILADNVK